ncbi:MAG: kinase-like domain-containing protein [Linnemannia gamsii]|nr:MAG: kinase-like domain-containing protein [Linnemannia gamsii]
MTESEIGWIMGQILLGLAYLHGKDHVHGDIKASNVMLTLDGHVKLGGSGSIMSHKNGAGERKRRRRSLTMSEFPTSWLAPESSLSPPLSPTSPTDHCTESALMQGRGGMSDLQQYRLLSVPGASMEADVWALGVACIELSQGRPPRPETPILASYGDWRYTATLGNITSVTGDVAATTSKQSGWCLPNNTLETVGMGMSEEMWVFIRKCLTPDPEERPTVQDLLQDPFIVQHDELSQELLSRIRGMVDFVGQCASISEELTLDRSGSDNSLSSTLNSLGSSPSSITLSPSKATHMIDFKMDEPDWIIPRIRPLVDSVYDESSCFDEAGAPRPVGPLEAGIPQPLVVADWKHQRMNHPKVMQALLCDQPRYLTFRHSRSPSLATIVEHHMEEDDPLFWSDHDESSSDHDGDDDSSSRSHNNDSDGKRDYCTDLCKRHSLPYPGNISNVMNNNNNNPSLHHPCECKTFQKDQDQRQQQIWTNVHDESDMKAAGAHAASQVPPHNPYLDNLAIENGCGLRSILEYDFHGASSRLVVLYEIQESWLQ